MRNLNLTGILCLLAVPLISSAVPAELEVSGNITQNTTWSAELVKVTGNVTIADDVILTIQPGTRVEFQGYFDLNVAGTIVAEGTADQSILFTINDITGYADQNASSGSWHCIRFDNGPSGMNGGMFDNDTSLFSWCVFEYCKSIGYVTSGAFNIERYSRIKISDCIFRNCYSISGSAISCSHSSPLVRHNIFTGCSDGAIISLSGNSDALIINNLIANNTGRGIIVGESNPMIIGNIIVNNSCDHGANGGGGIMISRSNALIINNTICNNHTQGGGGGIFISEADPRFYNNIIWGNLSVSDGDQIYLEITVKPDFYNCVIQGGIPGFGGSAFTGEYINSFESDPEFISPSAGAGSTIDGLNADWSPAANSPCINAGVSDGIKSILPPSDYFNSDRIKYGEIDIGAFEYFSDYQDVSEDIMNDVMWIADTVKIWNDISVTDGSTLTILPGTIVQFQGRYTLSVAGTFSAIGKKNEQIKFTVADTNYFSNPDSSGGGWGGLILGIDPLTNDSSIISWCVFEYGKSGSVDEWNSGWQTGDWHGGAIDVNNSTNIKITHCRFVNNRAKYGGAIFINNSDIYLDGNDISDNYAYVYGGGLYVGESNVTVVNNFISNNTSGSYGGGINISGSTTIPLIVNNIICNNVGSLGGGIACFTPASIINNTVCYNHARSNGGGICVYDCKPKITNSIIWGNTLGVNLNQIGTMQFGSPSIHHSNIQEGLPKIKNGIGEGVYINNIETFPEIVNPTERSGSGFTSMKTDWSLSDFSPCIDKGSLDFPEIPQQDILACPRVNNEKIDIGAIENQNGELRFVKQPYSQTGCEGENLSFEVETSDTAYIQWRKDGTDFPGANDKKLNIDSVTLSQQGNYTCIISNSYGSVESNSAYLLVTETPEILMDPLDSWVEEDKPAIFNVFARGSDLDYQWKKDGEDIPNAITPQFIVPDAGLPDEGQYSCAISNSCGTDISQEAHLYMAPQICMVTVSTSTGNNLMIWEKESMAPIMAYNVYRESQAAGIYDLLVTIPYDDLSIFTDTVADPTVQAYLYKITAIDSSGEETDADLCKTHKTIHLLVSTNPESNSTQLAWDRYYGFDYQTYEIFRSTTGTDFESIYTLSASLNSWTDQDALTGDLYYRIAVNRPDACYPSGGGLKAGSGPYQQSMSNLEDNKIKAGNFPPDTLWLDKHIINENNMAGAMVGRMRTHDPDSADIHTYMLVPGQGDEDNYSFTFLSDLLLAATIFDYETKDRYSIRVRSTDKTGNSIEGSFVIMINDLDESLGIGTAKAQQVMVYPNPFSESTTLVFPNPDGKSFRMSLMNASGKVLMTRENVNTDRLILHRQDLTKGIYIIELRGDKTYRGKLVVE